MNITVLSDHEFVPLLERVERAAKCVIDASELSVPIHDALLYAALLHEGGRLAVQQDDSDLLALMDADTAVEMSVGSQIAEKAHSVVLLGEAFPLDWQQSANVVKRPCAPPMLPNDRVLLLLSNNISLALFGQRSLKVDVPPEKQFLGGWTVQRSTVLHLAQALLGDDLSALLDNMPLEGGGEDRISSAVMRLTALHASALESREHLAAVEKSDLLSVLEILKAISAKRRAHDILYVFVEQIARIIDTDRCSIVRVWDNETQGHVLASHEDSRLSDCAIELAKYPELRDAIRTGGKIVIDDVHAHPLTMEYSPCFRKAGIASLLVMPIVLHDKHVGTLLLRAARRQGAFTLREISFFEIVSEAASNALERAHLFESIQIANERLERLAITDSLTGIYNRRYFHERFKQEFERALRYRLPFSCIIFDVDDFKKINDTRGHLVGDGVLKEIAERTASCTRRVDILARYGGEEFVVILPQTDSGGAAVEAERIRALIASKPFPDMGDNAQVTVSAGVASLDHATMKTCEDLLRAADAAMYDAKRQGKNRIVSFENYYKE